MLILASKSPRRKRFLEDAGIAFLCDPAIAPETPWDGVTPPAEYVRALANAKAAEVAMRHPGEAVLAADTIVVHGNAIFGKPRDLLHAKEMLKTLSGDVHHVLTGVAIRRDDTILRAWVANTTVRFKHLTDNDIDQYCAMVNVLDKAGAYGIQEHGELLVESLDGLWSNVVGLPIEEVLNELRCQKLLNNITTL